MKIVIKGKQQGTHVHWRIWCGKGEGNLAYCGKGCMRAGEWQLFGAALCLGAEKTEGHLTVDVIDE